MLYNCNGEFKTYDGDAWKKEHLPLRPFAGYLYPEVKFNNYKYFDDFMYKGHKYNLNSIVKLSNDAKMFLGADSTCTQLIQHEITNTSQERWGYVVRKSSEKTYHVFTTVPPEQLIEEIIVPATSDILTNKVQHYKDNEVDGMSRLWAIYIIAMVVITLFNDRIMMWTIASCIFFELRKKKLTKPPQHNYEVE